MEYKTKTMKLVTLLLCLGISISSFAQNTKYYRQLRYNHVSPFIEIRGVHPIDSTTASKTSHYIFKYDTLGRISVIVINHYNLTISNNSSYFKEKEKLTTLSQDLSRKK